MSIPRIARALERVTAGIIVLSLATWAVFFYGFVTGDDGIAIPWAVVTFGLWMVMSALVFMSLIIRGGECDMEDGA